MPHLDLNTNVGSMKNELVSFLRNGDENLHVLHNAEKQTGTTIIYQQKHAYWYIFYISNKIYQIVQKQ